MWIMPVFQKFHYVWRLGTGLGLRESGLILKGDGRALNK